jgi:hypothetical protein
LEREGLPDGGGNRDLILGGQSGFDLKGLKGCRHGMKVMQIHYPARVPFEGAARFLKEALIKSHEGR